MKAALLPSILTTAVGLMGGQSSDSSSADALAAERAAREEEERQEEAEERKQARQQTLEARELEQKKLADARRSTLLATGGQGLTDEAVVSSAQLKKTLGE